MTPIFVTVDFFLKDWYSGADPNPAGELWLCVQPHVHQSDLPQYLTDLAQTRNFSYALVLPGAAPNDLVPVSLPSDANLTIRFLPANTALPPLTNHRTTGVAWAPAPGAQTRLRELNLDPTQVSDRTADIDPGPFAPSYNKGLQLAWPQFVADQQLYPDRIALDRMTQMLQVAFWGGTPRVIPPSAFTGLDTVFLMNLPYPGQPPGTNPPPDTLTTNLHSLNGLLIRAGLRQNAKTLATVTNLEIAIDDGQPAPPVLATAASPLSQATVTAFFSSLPNDIPQHQPTAVWNPEFARRVYVAYPLMPFVQQPSNKPSTQGMYRRRSEGVGDEAQPDPSGVRSFVARYTTAPATPPSAPLLWNRFEAFDVTLKPYRDARTRPDDGKVLLQLTPSAASKVQFYAELASQLEADPTWLQKAPPPAANGPWLIGSDGSPLSLTFVTAAQFPWSEDPYTILYFGAAPADPAPAPSGAPAPTPPPTPAETSSGSVSATFLVKRSDQISMVWKGQDDPWGQRFESPAFPAGVAGSFSVLQLDASIPVAVAMNLAVGVAFAQQIRVEPAHSVSGIEGVLQVQYPNPHDLAPGDAINVEEEFKHDLLNYNALNVYSSLNGATPVALNPLTQLYPVYKTPGPVTIGAAQFLIFYFHFRYPDPVTPADNTVAPALFYERVYARMRQTRALTFAVEHTYGTEIGNKDLSLPSAGVPVAAPVDYAPALPNEVVLTAAAAKTYQGTFTHFCSIEFEELSTSVILHFATDWLSNTWTSPDLYPIQSAAWRSVAELSHASKIELTANFMRFRFETALAAGANTFGAGLEPVTGLENWSQDITSIVQSICGLWAGQPPTVDPKIEIKLALPAGITLAGNCVVLNFSLRVTRDPVTLPPASTAVDFVQPQPTVATDEQGQLMQAIPATEVGPLYDQWRAGLGQRSAPLEPYFPAADPTQPPPSEDPEKLAQLVSKLLSPGGASGEAPGNWIAMVNAPVPSAQAVVSACPFAFRPVMRDPNLGDNTFLALSLYFWALDLVLRGAVRESAQKDATAWIQYFTAIEAQLKSGSIQALIGRLCDLVTPLPNAESNLLDPEVSAAVTGFTSDPSLPSTPKPLRTMIQAWVTAQLWNSPSLFGDAKAFLYTRLHNSDSGSGAIDPFARLISPKQIHGIVGDPAWEEDRLLVWESLPESAVTTWFGFGEVLDELRYGDDFIFGDVRLSSLASLIAELGAPDDPSKDEIPAGPVHIPAPVVTSPSASPQAVVRLASRQPVDTPVCHFSLALDECQLQDDILRFSSKPISLDQLIQGSFPDPASIPALAAGSRFAQMATQQTTSFNRGHEQDLFVLSALFSVRGDETVWPGSFQNDRFFISEFSQANPLPVAVTVTPTPQTTWLSSLANQLHPDQIASLETHVLDPAVISAVAQALQALDPASDIALNTLLSQASFQVQASGANVTITIQPGPHPVEAYVFQTGVVSAANELVYDLYSALVLVNVLLPIWSPQALGMVQTRNLLPATAGGSPLGPDFGRDFAEISAIAAPQGLYQPFEARVVPPGAVKLKLARQQYSVTDIVTKLLLNDVSLPANSNNWNAPGAYLSVTVSALQVAHTFESSVSGGVVQDLGPQGKPFSSFVVRNYRFDPAVPAEYTTALDWFEADTSIVDYSFDFQWSSASNLQFFRLSGAVVQVV